MPTILKKVGYLMTSSYANFEKASPGNGITWDNQLIENAGTLSDKNKFLITSASRAGGYRFRYPPALVGVPPNPGLAAPRPVEHA